jgi:hypothetical protein
MTGAALTRTDGRAARSAVGCENAPACTAAARRIPTTRRMVGITIYASRPLHLRSIFTV